MKRWIGPFAVLAITAGLAHQLTLVQAPAFIMARAMGALAQRGVALHAFTTPERVTPQTQNIVRSSPDLYYALCRYDLSDPGMVLNVRMADWPDYQSLSFFDANTDNFLTLRGSGKAAEVRLVAPGGTGKGTHASPTAKGVILIRRLAPTSARYDAAKAAGAGDACQLES